MFFWPHLNYVCLSRANLILSKRLLSLRSKSVIPVEQHHVRQRQVKVCGRFAKHFALFRPWFLRYIPSGGYPIQINYIDTNPEASNDPNVKIILLLHGTPGSYYDYFQFIAEFGNKYRIIAPNFPDFNHTLRTGCFWHSAEEKSEFIMDFLKALNIQNIHCMVAHSLSVYAASYIWIYANNEDYFKLKSICLLSPAGKHYFWLRHRIRMGLITSLARTFALGKYLVPKDWINIKRSPGQNIFSRYDIAMWKAITQNLSNYQNYQLRLKMLARLKIPTLFIFSSVNDKQFPTEVYHDQLYFLEVNQDDFDIYEQYENNLIEKSTSKSWIKVVDFRSGGHFLHNTHSYLIHSYIDELLDTS